MNFAKAVKKHAKSTLTINNNNLIKQDSDSVKRMRDLSLEDARNEYLKLIQEQDKTILKSTAS